MAIYVNNNGWVPPKYAYIKDADVWKQASNIYIKDANVWKLAYTTVTITTNQVNYNLYTALGSPTTPISAYVTINAGVELTASLNTNYGFTTGALPAGSSVFLINNGYIVGKGGQGVGKGYINGARSVLEHNLTAPSESNGGPALFVQTGVSVTIDNTNGVIGGGGGGGGSGGCQSGDCSCTTSCCSSGSVSVITAGVGAGGAGYGAAGTGYERWWAGTCGWVAAGGTRANPLAGTPNQSTGGTLSAAGTPFGSGGAGGTLGTAGGTGTGTSVCSTAGTGPGTGGLAGACTVGGTGITWVAVGNRYGALN